jgi:ketosteroid isomerase-like protein
MRAFQVAMMALFLGACAQAPSGAPADAEKGVSEAVMGMYGAFQTRDLAKVGEFMTESSTCYNATTSEMLVGRKAVLDHFGAILGQHKPGEKWESSITDIKVDARGDFAVATYHVNTSQGGMHAVAAVTHVFQRIDGRWLATHLHRSWNAMAK